MIHDDEFDLTWADPPPEWIQAIDPLLEFWGNPIFQRRYVLWRLKPTFGIGKSFIIGFIASLLLNLFFMFVTDKESALNVGFWATIAIPGLTVIAITGGRLFINSIVGTPLEMRRELSSGVLESIYTTPIPDQKIFFAECVAGIMRGFGAIEEILAMVAGLVLPYLIVMSPQLWPHVASQGPAAIWWLVLLFMIVVIVIQLIILSSLSAGFMSLQVPILVTIPATLLVSLFWIGLVLWISFKLLTISYVQSFMVNIDPLVGYLGAATLAIIILMFACALTGYMGVVAFAKARRPGYYETDRKNAAGFLASTEKGMTSFGKSV